MRELTEKSGRIPGKELFRRGLIAGFGWSFGATIGIIIISTFIVSILNVLGGLPLIGSFIADVVEETQYQLIFR